MPLAQQKRLYSFLHELIATNFKNVSNLIINDIRYLFKNNNLLSTFKGHSGEAMSVSWSPCGKFIASGSSDKTVRIWNFKKGTIAHILKGHSNHVKSVSWSPDGEFIASGSMDDTVRIWDAKKGTVVHILKGHSSTVWSVSWSPNGKFIASGSADNTVRIWDAKKGALVHTLKGHSNEVNSVSWSPDGKFIASGSKDDTIKMWDAKEGRLVYTLRGRSYRVTSVSWSPDEKFIASGSEDQNVKIWDAKRGRLVRTLQGHSYWITSVNWSPDGEFVASGGWDKTIKIWDTKEGILVHTLKGYSDQTWSVSWNPNGEFIASGSNDKTVKIWQVFRKLNSQDIQQLLLNTLKNNTTVASLDFSEIKLQPADVYALCKLLDFNKHIVSVSLSNTGIGANEEIVKMLAKLLGTNTILKHLDLSGNKFNKRTTQELFIGLKKNPSSQLISLNLASNHIHCHQKIIKKHFKINQKSLIVDFSGNALLKNCKNFIKENSAFYSSSSMVQLKSTFSPNDIITRDKWIVAIGAKDTLTGGHAFGLVEGIRKNGQRFLLRCELITTSFIKGSGEVEIRIDIKNPFKDDKLSIIKKTQHIYRIFKDVERPKASMLITEMEILKKRSEEIKFSVVRYSKAKTVNCTKILIDKIIECDIPNEKELKELESWAAQNIPRVGAGGRACSIM